MNYGDFKTMVGSYLHRADLTTRIPEFIEFGRIRATDRLRVVEMEAKQNVLLTSGEGSLDEDLVAIRAVKDGDTNLLQVSPGQLDTGVTGCCYAIWGSTIAAPGLSDVDVYCYLRPETLVGASDSATRALLTYYPDIWLQAALVEGFRYLDNTDGETKAQDRLDSAIQAANARSAAARHGVGLAMSDPASNLSAGGAGL